MLRYLGHGGRQFGLKPVYVHRRANWEFFAVLKGECGPVLVDGAKPVLHRSNLWVFPPQTSHGWGGRGAGTCQVAIFHFATVADLLEKAVEEKGSLSLGITPAHSQRLARLVDELKPHYERMTVKSLLVFQRALLDLTLLALDQIPEEPSEIKSDFALRKTDAVMTWYIEHMEQQPKLEEAAKAVSLSVRHLRRLFQEARRESPQEAFTRLRVQRAMDLLSQTDRKMDTIVAACGFSSSSDFCRVFKARRGISPDQWRRQILRGCNESHRVESTRT